MRLLGGSAAVCMYMVHFEAGWESVDHERGRGEGHDATAIEACAGERDGGFDL